MTLYECDFAGLEEYLCDEWDDEPAPAPLGEFICKLLSIDFENVAKKISVLLWETYLEKKEFPDVELQSLIDSLCVTSEFCEIRNMVSILRTRYKAGETQEIAIAYGNLKNAFLFESFEWCEVAFVLQAYAEESENNPGMLSSSNFECFVNGFLDMKINRKEQAYSLSEYSLSSDIYIGCDARSVVKNVFLNLENFDDSFSVFDVDSLNKLLVSSMYYFFQNGFRFKRCKNCGRFFVPLSRSDELYCNNASPQDETRSCKEYGSQKLWYDRLKNDEVAKLARNVYSAKQMLVRRNPDILAYKEMFEYFKAERKKWEIWINSGEKSKEEYISWLNEMKAKKTL